jgi:hypothetical protein
MPISLSSMILHFGADTSSAVHGVDDITNHTKSMGGIFHATRLSMTGGMAAISEAVMSGVEVVKGFVEAAKEGQDTTAQLNAVLKSTGGAAGLSSAALEEMRSSLMGVTTQSDSAWKSSQTLLLGYTHIGKDVFPQAEMAAANLSARFGIGLAGASRLLGAALDNPSAGMGRLTRYTGVLDAATKEHIKTLQASGDITGAQTVLLDLLAKKMGGAATASAQTLDGAMTVLKNTVNATKERIGMALVPALAQLAGVIAPLFAAFASKLTPAIEWLTAFLSGAATNAIRGFNDVLHALSKPMSDLTDFAKRVGDTFSHNFNIGLGRASTIMHAMRDDVTTVGTSFNKAFTTMSNVWDHFKNLLGPGLSFGALFDTLNEGASKAGDLLGSVVTNAVGTLGTVLRGIGPAMISLWPAIKSIASSFVNLAISLNPVLNYLGTLWTYLGNLVTAAAQLIVPVVNLAAALGVGLVDAASNILPIIQGIGNMMSGIFYTALVDVLGALKPLIPILQHTLTDVFKALNPVLKIAGDLFQSALVPALGLVFGAIDIIIPVAAKMLEGMLNFVDWIVSNKPVLIGLGVALGTLGAVIGTVVVPAMIAQATTTVSTLVPSLIAWAAAQGAVVLGMIAFALPVIAVIAGITALVAGVVLLITHWNQVKEVLGHVKDWLGNVAGSIGDFFGKIFGVIGEWGHKILDLYTWPYRTAYDLITGALTRVEGAVGGALGSLGARIGSIMGGVGDALYKPFGDMFGRIGYFFTDWWGKISSGIKALATNIASGIGILYTWLIKPFVDLGGNVLGIFGTVIGNVAKGIGQTAGAALGLAGTMAGALFKGYGDALALIGNMFGNLLGTIGSGIGGAVALLLNDAGSIRDSLFKGFGDALALVGNMFGKLLGKIGIGIGQTIKTFGDNAGKVKDAILKPFGDAVGALANIFKGVANAEIDGINKFVFGGINKLINGISNAVDWVTDKLAIGKPLSQWEKGSIIPSIPHFHSGGTSAGGLAVVGKPGAEEIVMLPAGAQVISHEASKRLAGAGGGMGGGPFDWIGNAAAAVGSGLDSAWNAVKDWPAKGSGWLIDRAWDTFHLGGLSLPMFGNVGDAIKGDVKKWIANALGPSDGFYSGAVGQLFNGHISTTGARWWMDHITQGYHPPSNPTHDGVDFGVGFHTPIGPILGGPVEHVGYHPWGGEVDMWAQYGGRRFLENMTHLDYILPNVRPGAVISPGQVIGLSGGENPGYPGGLHPAQRQFSSGPHLHYSWFVNTPWGASIDPLNFLRGVEARGGGPNSAPVHAYANGGWITEPVAGVGLRSGHGYSFGEGGRSEYVSPSGQHSGAAGGITIHVQSAHEADIARDIAREQQWQAMLRQ